MINPSQTPLKLICSSLLFLALALGARAQTAPDSSTSAPTKSEELVFELSPFVVSTQKDSGYTVSDSLAGSRVRTQLRDLAAPISVITKDYLEDIAAFGMQDAIAFAAGSENNAQSIDPASGNGDGDLRSPNANRIRGLTGATTTRNFFNTDARLDRYNFSRLDIARGPNSILFGLGSPAGVVNASVDRAEFRNKAIVEAKYDSEGSHRASFAVSRSLIDQKLAVTLAGLHEQLEVWKKPSLDHQNRAYVAVQYRPFNSTTLNVNYEDYWNFRQLPRNVLPFDFVSTWVAAGKPRYAGNWSATAISGLSNLSSAFVQNANTYQPVFVNGSLGTVGQFYNRAGEVRTKGPHEFLTGVDSFRLSVPASILPIDINVAGPASSAEMDAKIFNASLEQRFGKDMSVEFSYNREESGNLLLDLGSPGVVSIYADPNEKLINGQANPNVGRFYFEDTPRLVSTDSVTNSMRLTTTYSLDLRKRSEWFGRHQFSLLGVIEERDNLLNTSREYITSNNSFLPTAALTDLASARRRLIRRFYLDDPSRPNGGNMAAVLTQLRLDGTIVGPDGTPVLSDPYVLGHISNSHQKLNTEALAAVWQGYLWKDKVVTTLGARRDIQKIYQAAGLTVGGTGSDRNLFLPAAQMSTPSEPTITNAANTYTKGIAFHAIDWLSFYYNQADNFSLSNGDVDLFNNPIPGSKGKGEDFSIGLRLWDGKMQLRATRYQTSQIGSRASTQRAAVRFNFDNIEDAIAAAQGVARDPNLAPAEAWTLQDFDAKGTELEVTLNPTAQWRIALNASEQDSIQTNIALQARQYLAARLPVWQQFYTTTLIGSTTTIQQLYEGTIQPAMDLAAASDGVAASKLAKWRFNAVTNYDFSRDGILKGFSIGGALRWVDAPVIGYKYKTVGTQSVPDISQPYYGAQSFSVDLSIRYTAKIAKKYQLRLQMNVRNVLNDDELAPIRIRSDGSAAAYQAIDPRLFVFSTSLMF